MAIFRSSYICFLYYVMGQYTFCKILIIQTAFIGDVILATALIEKLEQHYPDAQIDFLLRKGNENLLQENPRLNEVIVFDKSKKYRNLARLMGLIRGKKYDLVVNAQRFATTGMITATSGAKHKAGFNKNPLSFLFSHSAPHRIGSGQGGGHEIERNQELIRPYTDDQPAMPRLYPTATQMARVEPLKSHPYICIAPTSVWFTKQFPQEKWVQLIEQLPDQYVIYLLGAPDDRQACQNIRQNVDHKQVEVLAGKLSLMESAALMQDASMNYVNDSAPMHLASATNAPTCAVFCSTIPAFGFGPLSERSAVVETSASLECRPCGLHGHNRCPEGHFKCALTIEVPQLVAAMEGLKRH